MFYNRLHSIQKGISGFIKSYRKTIAYGLLALILSTGTTGCSGKIYEALFNDDSDMLLLMLAGGGAKVALTSTPTINNANRSAYTVSGTCSSDGQPVVISIGGGAVTANPICTAGAFTASGLDVSGVPDSATVAITADHTNDKGRPARQATASVVKDTIDPTVLFTSTPAISSGNVTAYVVSGDCSENGRAVSVSIGGGAVTASPTCSGGTFTTASLNVSGIADNPAVSITADHDDAAGNTATQASTTVIKNTVGPIVTIDSSPAINNTNKSNYSISGSCSANGQPVSISIGGGAVTASPNCIGGSYTASGLIVSGIADNPAVSITADHDDAVGNHALQASTTVLKDIVVPSGYSVAIDQSYITGANEDSLSFTFAGAEVGTTYSYTISSSGGGTPVTGTGTITGSGQQITGIDVSGLNDGTLTISVTLTDTAGNTGTAATDTALKDLAAPSGYSAAIDQTYITSANENALSFTFGSAEVSSTYNYTISSSGGGAPVTGTGTIASASQQLTGIGVSGLNDGTLTLSVTLTDPAGNTGSSATDTAIKDKVAPSGYSAVIDQTYINSGNVNALSFTFSSAEVGSTYNYTISSSGGGTPVTGTGTISSSGQQLTGIGVSGLNDGTLTISVTLTDPAGNTGSAATDTAVKDVAAPSGYSTVIDQTYINSGNENALSFTFGSAQVGATYNYTISSSGGGTPVTGTGTISSSGQQLTGINVSGLNDGTLTISATLTDTAGNTGSAATDTAIKDIVAPSGYSVNIDQTYINSGNVNALSFTFGSAQVGATYNYSISSSGGGTPVTGTGTIATATDQITGIDVTGLNDGTLTITVTLTDPAGNTGSNATDTIDKDVAPPSGYSVAIDQATINSSNQTAMSFTFSSAETGADYSYSVSSSGGGTPVTGSGTVTSGTEQITGINVSGLNDGTLTISVTLTDTAGNAGSAAQDTVAKNTTPLTISTAQTIDSDQNGKIDHYKLTFNKSVDDSTFPGFASNSSLGTSTTDWLVAGFNNRKFTGATYIPDIDGSDNADDSIIYILFDEKVSACDSSSQAGCDSGAKPDLTTTSTPGLADLLGNIIAQRDTGTTPAESDGAAPIVVKAEGINNTSTNLIFSESVAAASAECSGAVACASIYTITGSPAGLTVTEAEMSGGAGVDGSTVVLTTSSQTDLRTYTVTVTLGTVADLATNTIPSGKNTATFTGQPVELHLLSASAASNTSVNLTFNDSVKATTAECSGTCGSIYSIPGLTISAAVMTGGAGVDGTGVTLTTSTHTSNTIDGYEVTVTSGVVQNATGTVTCDSPYNTATFTGDTLPYLSTAASIDATHIDATFSEGVQWDTAANGALLNTNYCIELASDVTPQVCNNPALGANTTFTISSQVAGTVARITTVSSQVAGTLYRVAVFNVHDTTGNSIKTTANANTQTFTGLENIKIQSATQVVDNSTSFTVFKVTFSKAPKVDGSVNSVNYTGLVNWAFQGLSGVTLCTPGDDVVCPNLTAGDTSIYFKATPEPIPGAYTVIGATAAGSPTGAVGCIQNQDGTAACLQSQPNDRAALVINLPENIGQGWVYNDPFGDNVTYSGQVVKYNQKLLIGPNSVDSGLYQVEYNLGGPVNITLDADNVTSGQQPFRGNASPNNPTANGVWESCTDPSGGSLPGCTSGNYLGGIDYFYAGCYDTGSPWVDTTLTGQDCTDAGGTEYLMILGYVPTTGVGSNNGYQSNWTSTSTTTPFAFSHLTGLSNYSDKTFRAMSVVFYKGWVYQASQHQLGSMAIRWNRFRPNPGSACPGGGNTTDTGIANGTNDCYRMSGSFLNRMAQAGTIKNGQGDSGTMSNNMLISIDTMFEHDNDGTSGSYFSSLYIANGGSCVGCLTSPYPRNTTTFSDGGILRTRQGYSDSTPPSYNLGSAAGADLVWEDVTPSAQKWRSYMSIALPQDARATHDWDYLEPANTITPSIKAVPKMVTFNGDLYMLRNACSTETVQTLNGSTHRTCPTANVIPQLWRLPKYTGSCTTSNLTGTVSVTNNTNTVTGSGGTTFTTSFAVGDTITAGGQTKVIMAIASDASMTTTETWNPAVSGTTYRRVTSATDSSTCSSGGYTWTSGTNGANGAAHWELVAENASTGRTDMTGATWPGGSSQSTLCGNNTEITLLVVNGDRLYIGFDNATDGTNIWRTKSGVTKPTSDSDFEAVCGTTGTVCAVASKQFGWAGSNTKIFDGISVNDGGTDYVVITARTGTAPLRIYRTTNN